MSARSLGLMSNPGLMFFREVCKLVPGIMTDYQLGELVTRHRLCSLVAERFRHNQNVSTQAVPLLIYKGRQTLEEVLYRHQNRHHIITAFIASPTNAERTAAQTEPSGFTGFLDTFLQTNYPDHRGIAISPH